MISRKKQEQKGNLDSTQAKGKITFIISIFLLLPFFITLPFIYSKTNEIFVKKNIKNQTSCMDEVLSDIINSNSTKNIVESNIKNSNLSDSFVNTANSIIQNENKTDAHSSNTSLSEINGINQINQSQQSFRRNTNFSFTNEQNEQTEKKFTNQEYRKEQNSIEKTFFVYFVQKNSNKLWLSYVPYKLEYNKRTIVKLIQLLINGPDEEKYPHLFTCLPDTRLLGAKLVDNILYLDFDEKFHNNSIEGLEFQISQIVYTLTELDEISEIKILINGEDVNFIGREGAFVNCILNRNDTITQLTYN